MNIDFRFSDVYLFAKVLWMTLKELSKLNACTDF